MNWKKKKKQPYLNKNYLKCIVLDKQLNINEYVYFYYHSLKLNSIHMKIIRLLKQILKFNKTSKIQIYGKKKTKCLLTSFFPLFFFKHGEL